MSPIRTLDSLPLHETNGRAVFVRVDFNVPLQNRVVVDSTRLHAALPTISELQGAGARVIVASHLGRPEGSVNPDLSLRPVGQALAELLGAAVSFAADCIGDAAHETISRIGPGDVCLLENLRFHPGEKQNDPKFVAALAEPFDLYVNDAFGAAHRAHASVVGVPKHVTSRAAGRLVIREVQALERLLSEPSRPFIAIVGGAKIGGKSATLLNLVPRLDALLLGGGMANTFLAAQGKDLGTSLVERGELDTAKEVLKLAAGNKTRILLPSDLVVTDDPEAPQTVETVTADSVPPNLMAVDIGDASLAEFTEEIRRAGTIFWNGPMGIFERPPFDRGTFAVARAVADSAAHSVAGGGETVSAIQKSNLTERFGHISTGGGAALEFLAGSLLPGLQALQTTPTG